MSLNLNEVKAAINAYYKEHRTMPHLLLRRNDHPAFVDECLKKGIKVSIMFKQTEDWKLK